MEGIRGLRDWQWLFLLEGLPIIPLGIVIYLFLGSVPILFNVRVRRWVESLANHFETLRVGQLRKAIANQSPSRQCRSSQWCACSSALCFYWLANLSVCHHCCRRSSRFQMSDHVSSGNGQIYEWYQRRGPFNDHTTLLCRVHMLPASWPFIIASKWTWFSSGNLSVSCSAWIHPHGDSVS